MAVDLRDDPRVRKLRKKIAQIASLEDRLAGGELLDAAPEVRLKLARRAELEEELRQLLATGEAPADNEAEEEAEPSSEVAATLVQQGQALRILHGTSPWGKPDQASGLQAWELKDGRPVEAKLLDDAERWASQQSEGSTELPADASPVELHSTRWEDDPVSVEDVAPNPQVADLREAEILEAVQPFGAAAQADARLRRLVRATSRLSLEAFETDVLEGVTRKGRWRLTLLAQPGDHEDDPWGGLLGFIAYKLKPQVQCLSIAKLAVVPEQRGRGHGHTLIQWAMGVAKKQANIMYLSLTSLPQAIRFYKKMGFKQVDVDLTKVDTSLEEDYEFVEGQVYMEYCCRGRAAHKRQR